MPTAIDRMETNDLEAWGEDDPPNRLRKICRRFKIRPAEVGNEEGYQRLIDDIQSGGAVGTKAFITMARIKLLIINLMRAECQLPFTADPVADWPKSDYIVAPWGNDFETSDNPKNKKGNRNTTSPRPGWWFRMVEANPELVVKVAEFWEPEGKLAPERREMLERSGLRKRGQEVLKAVMELPDSHFKATKAGKRKKALA